LLDNAPKESQRNNRDGFKNSVWVALSVGHNVNAEPRWILPMLCGAGHLTKGKIGAIKIQQDQTFVELTADCVDAFFESIGATGKIEKDIVVTRVNGTPPASKGDSDRPKRSYNDKKKPYKGGGGGRSSERSNSRPGPGDAKRPFKKKPKGNFGDKPSAGKPNSTAKPFKEGAKKPKKSYPKKP